jgi:nucleotide-binding universal stress UspA family protein
MVPDRRFVFIRRRTGLSGRSLRCAETVARAGHATLVVEDEWISVEELLHHDPRTATRNRASGRRARGHRRKLRLPTPSDASSPDLVLKVPEPASPTPPRRLHPLDRAFLRRAPRPLWLLHPAQGPDLRVVLAVVGLDGRLGPADQTVLRSAASLSRSLAGSLHVVLPWSFLGVSILASPTRGLSPERTRSVLGTLQSGQEDRLEEFVSSTISGARPRCWVRRGDALSVVQEVAWEVEADVVVSAGNGAVGPGSLVMGSFPERLALATPASLLLVKSGEWEGWDEAKPSAIRHPMVERVAAGVGA